MYSAASLFETVQAMLPDERPNITRIVMVGCLSPSLILLRMEKSSCTCGPSFSRPCRVRDPTSFSVLGTRATSLVDVCGLACTLRDRGPCLHGSCDVAPRVSELFKKDCPRPGSNFHLRTPSPTNAKTVQRDFPRAPLSQRLDLQRCGSASPTLGT